MAIPFTQYMRPDGRPVAVSVDRPPAAEAMAREVIAAGWRFECEHMLTGQVHLFVTDPATGQDVCGELCDNGPTVPAAVDRLVAAAHALLLTQPGRSG